MNSETAAFLLSLKMRVSAAMGELGEETVERTQQDIASPFPPASTPGTPPHLRTGNLRGGVHHWTAETGGNTIRLAIISDRVEGDPGVPAFLEFGTSKMQPRPYMRPRMDELEQTALATVAAKIQQ